VPIGVKQHDAVEGWPLTEPSVVFEDRVSDFDWAHRTGPIWLEDAGALPVGHTSV
jgi:hypothetical protein